MVFLIKFLLPLPTNKNKRNQFFKKKAIHSLFYFRIKKLTFFAFEQGNQRILGKDP
jgi:hypothetical protein